MSIFNSNIRNDLLEKITDLQQENARLTKIIKAYESFNG
jgi:hypothetical protein